MYLKVCIQVISTTVCLRCKIGYSFVKCGSGPLNLRLKPISTVRMTTLFNHSSGKKNPNVKQTVQDFIIPQMTQRLSDCFRMLILIM